MKISIIADLNETTHEIKTQIEVIKDEKKLGSAFIEYGFEGDRFHAERHFHYCSEVVGNILKFEHKTV